VQSYLNVPNLLAAAISRGAGAIHPGYGFLSENATFVQMCADHGILFIGPSPDSITTMGDKATARKTMMEAGVPCVPGSPGLVETEPEAQRVRHDFALMHGGVCRVRALSRRRRAVCRGCWLHQSPRRSGRPAKLPVCIVARDCML
jgi:Biotin carboxylase, N-terminal domain